MITRFEADEILRAAVSGQRLEDGEILYWSAILGWSRLDPTHIFDVDFLAGIPRLKYRDVFDAGSKGANFTLDAANGLTQKVTLTASCSLTGISNLIGTEPFSLRVDVSGGAYTFTLDSGAFEGPQLTFSGTAGAISFVDFNIAGGKITAMGNDWT